MKAIFIYLFIYSTKAETFQEGGLKQTDRPAGLLGIVKSKIRNTSGTVLEKSIRIN